MIFTVMCLFNFTIIFYLLWDINSKLKDAEHKKDLELKDVNHYLDEKVDIWKYDFFYIYHISFCSHSP